MYNKFSEVFLNLKVLILKLSVVGPADVLGDFIRYESYIIQNVRFLILILIMRVYSSITIC